MPSDMVLADLCADREKLRSEIRDTHLPGVLNLAPDRKARRAPMFEALDAINLAIANRRRELHQERKHA
jgi:hypothetical protein